MGKQFKRAKVLLVDDSPPVLAQEQQLLEKTGVVISTAMTGSEAVKRIHMEKPDLVFLDLMLPEINGDAVCRMIKNDPKTSGTTVIIVTAKTDEETMQRCFRSGCDAFIKKPFTADEILNKLKVVLDEKEIYLDWGSLEKGES